MSNQVRASRHASGILPSKQFFAPRKPITQNASRRKSTTLSIIVNSSSAPGESQGISVRTSPIRPPSALQHQQNQDESEDFSHSTINSVLEPITPTVVLEPSSYRQIRHGGSNLLSSDFSTSFSRHSDSDSSGTLSTQLQMIPPKKLSQTKPPINDSPYASFAKSMPRIVYNSAPISRADSRGRKRLYQVWPGRNRFFLGGRIMTSRDFTAFLIAFSALVVPSGLFLAFTLIIPRNLDPSPPTEDLEDPENNVQNNPNSPYYPMRSVPLPKEVNINGQTIRLKYCETCRIYRPPRCSHCRQCDNCVENEDHHCIWLNNCIGRRNYRTFFTFIATATILCVYVTGFCLVHLFLLMKEREFNFISAVIIAPVRYPCIRIPIPRRNGTRNPFDYRNMSRNCMWVLCRPLTKSSVSRRAYVEEEVLNIEQVENVLNDSMSRFFSSYPTIRACAGIASWIPVIIWSLDHGYSISSVSGRSMQPTFNPDSNKLTRDIVLLNRQAAISHKYKRGDVILNGFSAPDDPNKVITKRIIALEGDTVFTLPPYPDKFLRIPNGHCWVEGTIGVNKCQSNTRIVAIAKIW
ncbi:20790_t:CDS:2 [Cetraspora pellucida]|uniref:Palmitoyltransferase n=1 Tax=Cetraspora pellucida TaxID=1433469 RepID=A0A9N9DWI4_9GLOM|nr:20790_t:CDS:2 [Cetraspora pellucida]